MNSEYLLKCSYPSKYKTKRGRHVRLFSDPLSRTLPTLMIQVEYYYSFSSLCMRMREKDIMNTWESVWRSYLYLERSVPSIFRYGNIENCPWDDKGESLAKVHLDWCQSRFGRTTGSAGPTWPPLAGWLTGGSSSLICQCWGWIRQFVLKIGPSL